MIKHRLPYFAAAGMLLATLLAPAGAFAQGNGNTGNTGCTQTATGIGGATTGGAQNNRANSTAILVGVVDAAVQDVQALNNINAALSALNGPIQVVCLNNVLNQNDIRILQDILNGSPILNDNLNGSLNNNAVLNGLLQGANIALLPNANVVAVSLTTGQVFVIA